MNRVVMGSAALGSRVSQAQAKEVLRAACDAGLRRFDTAPYYGAGFAAHLLESLTGEGIRVSTKFGSRPEPLARFLLKRVLRSTGPLDAWRRMPPLRSSRGRNTAAWWELRQQRSGIMQAVRALVPHTPEHLFLHAPPLVLPPATLDALSAQARIHGCRLGLCSPRREEIETWLDRGSVLGCIQLHLDDLLAVSEAVRQRLLRRELWVHGVYSPGLHSALMPLREREAALIDLARGAPELCCVAGATSQGTVARLADLAARMG